MYLFNVLAAASSTIVSYGSGAFGNFTVSYQWLCNIIAKIIEFSGDVGLGVILFTVILKVITLAPDVFSRVSMKKNALKMEEMREDLEKLQKQYANDKVKYQQKIAALYKKNGYSAFSACLPTIITLVFFFIVIGAFNSYSQRSEFYIFKDMGAAYDEAVDSFTEGDNPTVTKKDNGYELNFENILKKDGLDGCFTYDGTNFELVKAKTGELVGKYSDLGKYFENGEFNKSQEDIYSLYVSACQNAVIKRLDAEKIKSLVNDKIITKSDDGQVYAIYDLQKFIEQCPELSAYFKDGEEGKVINYEECFKIEGVSEAFEAEANSFVAKTALEDYIGKNYRETVVLEKARRAAETSYKGNKAKSKIFPWIKNIWAPDCAWSAVIPTHKKLVEKLGGSKNQEKIGLLAKEETYNELTYYLADYKKTGFSFKYGNGWFILVVLSIGSMIGSTVIMNKTQKTQIQLSSVEGDASTAASTQKMMNWMMPIMFGVFAFIYSAAFSVYMITNSLLSTGSTLLINFIVERSFKKKAEKLEKERIENHRYGKLR